jgi:hypothetical protein
MVDTPGVREARRYLPAGSADALEEFAVRQEHARRRLAGMLAFYGAHRCRLARIHLLTAAALTLGRFNGFSRTFDEIGARLMPVDEEGKPRGTAWERFAEACTAGRPWETRDELWMAAHFADMQGVRDAGLVARFGEELEAHRDDRTWLMLRQHMDATLGARLLDGPALQGALAYETAISQGIAVAVWRLLHASGSLVLRYAMETARAVLWASPISYRRAAWVLVTRAVTAWSASRVYRRGVRLRERGAVAAEEGWPLLERALGSRVAEVDPLIARFYRNPSKFEVKVSLELNTAPAKFWSRVATLLVGQGLFEAEAGELDARFRVFRRADGSMHFVRELYVRGTLRVFDSDFVVRDVGGVPTFFEVFVDHGVAVEMDLLPLAGGGLSIRGRRIHVRGLRLPAAWLQVEFISRVLPGESGGPASLAIDGYLLMQPKSAFGRFLARKVLRRPEQLGCIHYRARPSAEALAAAG